jgi:hypothetical protein
MSVADVICRLRLRKKTGSHLMSLTLFVALTTVLNKNYATPKKLQKEPVSKSERCFLNGRLATRRLRTHQLGH